MKKYRLIDIPAVADMSRYEKAILKATELLSVLPEVRSIYQIGGVSAPGISDIDLLVVFKDKLSCGYSLHERLTQEEKYLFVHQLYGVSEDYLSNPLSTIFFGDFRLLFGPDLITKSKTSILNVEELHRQVAVEFLLKMYMVMDVQKAYRMIKARAFMLEAHGLKYDLQFLKITSGKLVDAVNDVIKLRADWFNGMDMEERLIDIFERIFNGITEVLSTVAVEGKIFLPENGPLRSGNVLIRPGDALRMSRKGLIVPTPFEGKKRFNFLHRINRFTLSLPFNRHVIPDSLKERFQFCDDLRKYNLIHLPDFLPLVSSLKLNG